MTALSRHGLSAVITAALLCTGATPSFAPASAAPGIPPESPQITYSLTLVATGLTQPLFVTHAGDDRLFVVEKIGRIKIVSGGSVAPEPFLDVSAMIATNGERGLLGLAFEPAFEETGRFYVYYSLPSGDNVIARYTTFPTDTAKADPLSATALLTISHPGFSNHNGGWMAFGPDNLLYAGTGDGGGSYDTFCAAQDVTDLRGKLLRLDVIGQLTYTTPTGNVFTPTQRAEIYAIGLRNPWRASFDRATGDLYIGDVGQSSAEEVDVAPAGAPSGLNFGWSEFEGAAPASRPPALPVCNYSGIAPTPPILVYPHAASNSTVIGGYVYRGASQPWLQGVYFYGDFGSGRIWGALPDGNGQYGSSQVIASGWDDALTSFGEDRSGELYVTQLGAWQPGSGAVYRIDSQLPRRVFLPISLRLGSASY